MKEIIVSEKAWKQKNAATKQIISGLLIEDSPQVITIDYDFVCQNQHLNREGENFYFTNLELKGDTYSDKINSIFYESDDLGEHSIICLNLSCCPMDIIPQLLREIVVRLAEHEKTILALILICSERQFCQHLFEIASIFRVLPLNLSARDLKYIIHRQKILAFRAKYREIFLPFWKAKNCLKSCINKAKHLIK